MQSYVITHRNTRQDIEPPKKFKTEKEKKKEAKKAKAAAAPPPKVRDFFNDVITFSNHNSSESESGS